MKVWFYKVDSFSNVAKVEATEEGVKIYKQIANDKDLTCVRTLNHHQLVALESEGEVEDGE